MKNLSLKIVTNDNVMADEKVINFTITTDNDKVLAVTSVTPNQDGSYSFRHRTTFGGIVYKLVLKIYNIIFTTRLTLDIDKKISVDKNANMILSAISSLFGRGYLPVDNNFWSFDREEIKGDKKVKVYSFNNKEAIDYISSISTPASI